MLGPLHMGLEAHRISLVILFPASVVISSFQILWAMTLVHWLIIMQPGGPNPRSDQDTKVRWAPHIASPFLT